MGSFTEINVIVKFNVITMIKGVIIMDRFSRSNDSIVQRTGTGLQTFMARKCMAG